MVKMHSFRLRYVVLGLLVYLQNAFSQSCGPKFDDISSKAYQADVVIRGTVLHADRTELQLTLEPIDIRVEKVYKGEDHLDKHRRRFLNIRLASLSLNDTAEDCNASRTLPVNWRTLPVHLRTLSVNSTLLFFMFSSQTVENYESHPRRHKSIKVHTISALPESDSTGNERRVKKILRDNSGKLALMYAIVL